jgi:protein-S-isoprenylcysteine O-methyltransferase Ste14
MAGRNTEVDPHNETLFRAMIAALFGTALCISAYYRRKADQVSGKVSWRDEGLPTIVALRVSGLTLWLSVMAYLVNPRWMRWSQLRLPPWVRWLGAALGVTTLPLLYWLFRSIGTNITPTVATRTAHTLITHGPYRWVRHPLYSVGTMFFVSLSLLAANWFIGLMSAVALVQLVLRLPKEEARLIARFGDQYRAYMQHTGRLVPRVRRRT